MTVMWLSIIGMWFCIGMAFFAVYVNRKFGQPLIEN